MNIGPRTAPIGGSKNRFLSTTAVPLLPSTKETADRGIPPAYFSSQLLPPSVVLRILPVPLSPTATPVFGSLNQTLQKW